MTGVTATEPIIRARLAKVTEKQYHRGVLGVRSSPTWTGGRFDHDGVPVTVVGCPSVLAIWEAIVSRNTDGWTVVLTDVDDADLGDTVLAHLLDNRLFTPDPWDALRSNFAATSVEPALYRVPHDRALADGLLAVLPTDYAPAPGGVLTRDHAMTAVARDVLQIVAGDAEVDALAILEWSLLPGASDRLAALRAQGGEDLAVATTAWLESRTGLLAAPLRALVKLDHLDQLVPAGIVAGLFCHAEADERGFGRFQGHFRTHELSPDALNAWYTAARGLVVSAVNDAKPVLAAARTIADELGLGAVATASDLLPQGLTARIDALGEALVGAVASISAHGPAPAVDPSAATAVEAAWAEVELHVLAADMPSVDALRGAVRLVRWLATPVRPPAGLSHAITHYVADDSWADTALVAARRGAEQPTAARALGDVISAVLTRRAVVDRSFAAALAATPQPAIPVVETLLRETVVPTARLTPTLLLVVDALSVAAANDLVNDLAADGWTEVSGDGRRGSALAALPTLTQRSRCSLLCGELREGDATVERRGFTALLRAERLSGTDAADVIFHKAALDALPAGSSLATAVADALADVERRPLVAAVLNYVDDTLHHTDPGGTDWSIATITHLRALLAAAREAGRAVVITSDHGHLIEHGSSTKVARAAVVGQRAHNDLTHVDPQREVLVEGPRVLTESKQAVLAVDPDVRYGARNAGYHGGGAPAEAIVPVLTFTAGRLPVWARPVAAVEPTWWYATAMPPPLPAAKRPRMRDAVPSLFDDLPDTATPPVDPLPKKVVAGAIYRNQKRLAGRTIVTDDQVSALLAALLATDAREIRIDAAASVIVVAHKRARGALEQIKRLLDVEGYAVLTVGDGVVRLDEAALREQFGVPR